MSTTSAVEKLLKIARAEIGYLEKETNSQLDDKTANAGDNNWNKYARDLDLTNLYNGKKNGYSWCTIFVDWCFIQAFGFDTAVKITYEQLKGCGAGCTQSAQYFKNNGKFFKSNPQPGDQIFFTNDGGSTFYHTGIVEKVENNRVYTIEGNTSSLAGVVENGGCVRDKSYSLSYGYIGGYGRPNFAAVDETSSSTSTSTSTNTVVAASTTYSTPKVGTVNASGGLNVRYGPATTYSKLGSLTNGDSVTIVGADSSGKWYRITASGIAAGWVSASYIKITTSTSTSTKTGKVTALLGVNVRSGAGTSYSKIGALTYGTTVTILDTNSNGSWYKVQTSKYTGWVSASYIKITSATTTTTSTTSTTTASTTKKTTTAALRLRAGRGTSYKILTVIPKGTSVQVSDLSNGWYKVKYLSMTGYCSASYLK